MCQAPCTRNSDCKAGQTCSASGHCEATACSSADDCPANFECNTAGACQRTSCTGDADCPDGVCVKGQCYDSYGTCTFQPA